MSHKGLFVRQLFIFAALLSPLLTSAPGCRSLGDRQTAARGNQLVVPAEKLAARSATDSNQRIEPIGFDSIGHSPVPVSLVGTIGDDSDPSSTPTDTQTFAPIDIVPQPQSQPEPQSQPQLEAVSISDWGHSQFSDRQVETSVTCRDCDSGRRGHQPEIYQEFFDPAMHAIRVGDELEIKFPHKPLFSEKVMVREDGMIAVPLIKPVLAAGLTPEMLQAELAKRYRALQYDPSANRTRPVKKKYLLSVKDRLDIRFDSSGVDSPLDKLCDSVTIRPDGKISLPLIGTLTAEGKTPEELEAEVVARYQKFYKEASPVLIVREFTNNQVFVDGAMKRTGLKDIDDVVVLTRSFERMVYVAGEVVRPGFVKIRGPMTVSQAIIAAGGPKRTAEMRTVARFRQGVNNQAVGELLNLKSQWTYEGQKRIPQHMRLPIQDLPLGANDVVIVPKTTIGKVTDVLEQYVYQLVPMTRNTQFQYLYSTGGAVGAFGF
jgi:protein involved in polysaccharide export with SLBB domain